MNLLKNNLVKGTLILTAAGIISRIIGFIYKIYLADLLGASLLGIYQLIFPIFGICFTIYGSGIQTALSQMIAANREQTRKIFFTGLSLSLLFACLLTILLHQNASWLAKNYLLEPACAPYLKILALLFPFCSVSACIHGYSYGIQNAKIAAIAQLIEQLGRVCFVCLMGTFFPADPVTYCRIATWGLVVGEVAGFLFNLISLLNGRQIFLSKKKQEKSDTLVRKKYSPSNRHSCHIRKKMLQLSMSLTSSKLIISLLHSIEAIFIPAALRQYGYSAADALATYGILSGMALPFIFFPSTITSSLGIMLLPAIAKSHAENDKNKIAREISATEKGSLLLGFFCMGIFLVFGNKIGMLFFQNETAGTFLTILALLCPFLYLSNTYTSIINGLGKTHLTFLITTIGMLIKLYFLVVLTPAYGIQAYLIGMLFSQIFMTVWQYRHLKKYRHIASS